MERCLEDEKDELGMSHFEVRKYGAILRHLWVTQVSHLFVARQTVRLRGEKSTDHAVPSPHRSQRHDRRPDASSQGSRWPSGSGPTSCVSSSAARSATPAGLSCCRPSCAAAHWSCCRLRPERVLDAIEKHRITATMLVPTMLYTLLDHPRRPDRPVSLRDHLLRRAAMSPTRLAEAIERSGRSSSSSTAGRGPMTIRRCARRSTTSTPRRLAMRPAGPWLDVRAPRRRRRRGGAMASPGEICVRGPIVMEGYWNKPERDRRGVRGGWLHTGDVARADEEGFLHHRRPQEGHDRQRWVRRSAPLTHSDELRPSVSV